MRTTYCCVCLIVSVLFVGAASAQTINFDETWKEFLENNKVSNMSQLVKPDKVYDQADYAKYLLMNTNTNFCQSEVSDAETLMTEIQGLDSDVLESIPGFVRKKQELERKIEAYHDIDALWDRFLQTKAVTLEELEAVPAARTNCEKKTLAKYSYMMAYQNLCRGDVSGSKNIFENRTLQLTEKTSLRIEDVEGLAAQVAEMKTLFQTMANLDVAWKTFVSTGVSPGFEGDVPAFTCYPVPAMKALLLNGVLDICKLGPATLEKIRKMQAESGVALDREFEGKVKELEAAIQGNEARLTALNEAWEAFLPDNRVKHVGQYGYDYCDKEPLIRAYILDGFTYVCEKAEESLQKIDALQREELTELEETTMIKINELAALNDRYQSNGVEIEKLWRKFIAQGDTLFVDHRSTDFYCDYIQQVKDWTIAGLCGTCEEGNQYLEKIEDFQETFEFAFVEELECRVRKLRIRVWDCRYQALQKLARVEVSPDAYDERLRELMKEYEMGPRPQACPPNE